MAAALAVLLAGAAAPVRAQLIPRLSVSDTFLLSRPVLHLGGSFVAAPDKRLLVSPSYPPLDLGLRTLRLVSGQNQLRFSPYIGTSELNLGGLRIRF